MQKNIYLTGIQQREQVENHNVQLVPEKIGDFLSVLGVNEFACLLFICEFLRLLRLQYIFILFIYSWTKIF